MKEREEKCLCEKKNAGFCKHCFEKNLTQPSVPAEKLNYERDYSHIHCWDQSNKLTIAACGKLRKEHKQCCLCEKLPPEEAKEGWEEKFDSYKFIEGGAPNKTKSKLIKAFISNLLSKAKTEEREKSENFILGLQTAIEGQQKMIESLLESIRNKEE